MPARTRYRPRHLPRVAWLRGVSRAHRGRSPQGTCAARDDVSRSTCRMRWRLALPAIGPRPLPASCASHLQWYRGGRGGAFDTVLFTHHMTSLNSRMGTALVSQPRSSGGGSSGGSGSPAAFPAAVSAVVAAVRFEAGRRMPDDQMTDPSGLSEGAMPAGRATTSAPIALARSWMRVSRWTAGRCSASCRDRSGKRAAPPDERNRIASRDPAAVPRGRGSAHPGGHGLGDKWDAKRRDIFAVEEPRRRRGGGSRAARRGARSDHRRGLHASALRPRCRHHLPRRRRRAAAHVSGSLAPRAGAPLGMGVQPYAEGCGVVPRAEDFSCAGGTRIGCALWMAASEIYPGLEVIPLDGHTTAMQGVCVGSPGPGRLLFVADLVPTSAHLRWPYIMGYDNEPLVTLAEKQRLLVAGRRGRHGLIFQHDPEVTASAPAIQTDRGVEIARNARILTPVSGVAEPVRELLVSV